MRSLFASLRTCGAQGRSTQFSMSGKRESLIFADWKALCMFRWQRFRRAPTTSPTNQLLVVICHHGARSQMVVDFLRNAGFDNAVNLDGGIDAWACEVDQSMRRYR
jgi:rhodanese-related sulfurtransferase